MKESIIEIACYGENTWLMEWMHCATRKNVSDCAIPMRGAD
jgi:hypothetical protein